MFRNPRQHLPVERRTHTYGTHLRFLRWLDLWTLNRTRGNRHPAGWCLDIATDDIAVGVFHFLAGYQRCLRSDNGEPRRRIARS